MVHEEERERSPDLNPRNRSIPALPKSGEPFPWSHTPFQSIPITPTITRHGSSTDAPPVPDATGGRVDPMLPIPQHNPSRSASRAPSRSSRRSRSNASDVVPDAPGHTQEPSRSASRVSSAPSSVYGVIDAIAVPGAVSPTETASRSTSRASRSRSVATTRLDPASRAASSKSYPTEACVKSRILLLGHHSRRARPWRQQQDLTLAGRPA